jgi:hypothetical protein
LVRSPSPSPQPTFPTSLKEVARGLITLFHICILSLSTIFPHLRLLHSPFLLPQVSSPTVPILQCCLSLLISKSVLRACNSVLSGIHNCMCLKGCKINVLLLTLVVIGSHGEWLNQLTNYNKPFKLKIIQR